MFEYPGKIWQNKNAPSRKLLIEPADHPCSIISSASASRSLSTGLVGTTVDWAIQMKIASTTKTCIVQPQQCIRRFLRASAAVSVPPAEAANAAVTDRLRLP
jgi:hypothetical protein